MVKLYPFLVFDREKPYLCTKESGILQGINVPFVPYLSPDKLKSTLSF